MRVNWRRQYRNLFTITSTALLLSFQNCSLKGMEAASEAPSFVLPRVADYKPTNLTKAVVGAAKTFVNRLPTADELERAALGVDGYKEVIDEYLSAPQFRTAMYLEHQNYLKLGGVDIAGIDWGEPSRLGAHLIMSSQDYSNILKASYCVDQNYQVQPFCSSFSGIGVSNDNAAGILTMRAYIATHKPKKAFNFRIVNDAFIKFNCAAYPDSGDTRPMAPSEISNRLHPWGTTENNCYGCHRTINPKASLYYYYTPEGQFVTSPLNTTRTDSNVPSVIDDILAPCATPKVNGTVLRSVKDMGAHMADDLRFDICMARRYVNFMLGKSYEAELPEGMNYLTVSFRDAGRNVKALLKEIATSAAFVNRGEIATSGGQ